jgi:hypothetical protein
VLVESAETPDPEERRLSLALFGRRDELMESIRKRLLAEGQATSAKVQEALSRPPSLFERILWLARDSMRALVLESGEPEPEDDPAVEAAVGAGEPQPARP